MDLPSRHVVLTNARGLASFEDPDGCQKASVHADGTQITRTMHDTGYTIEIAKEPMAFVRCEVTNGCIKTVVECMDGACLEVVPQAAGAVPNRPVPLCIEEDVMACSLQASCVLTCRGGTQVVSDGAGDVRVVTKIGRAHV